VPTYECVFILNPQLSDEQTTETIDQIKSLISEHQGEIIDVNIWGKKRLSYEIQKVREGFFVLFTFKLQEQTPLLAELERVVKLSEAMIRHMIVKIPAIKPAVDKEAPPQEPEKVEAAAPESSTDSPSARPPDAEPPDVESPAAPTEPAEEKPSSQGGTDNA
jgi:small subunit ribosomal protein S6